MNVSVFVLLTVLQMSMLVPSAPFKCLTESSGG